MQKRNWSETVCVCVCKWVAAAIAKNWEWVGEGNNQHGKKQIKQSKEGKKAKRAP